MGGDFARIARFGALANPDSHCKLRGISGADALLKRPEGRFFDIVIKGKTMTSQIMRRAPDIARNFVGIWNDHCQAYDELALPYVDYLIEEIVAAEQLKAWQVERKITSMIPRLTPGTASRLMGMKYPHGDGGGFLTSSRH